MGLCFEVLMQDDFDWEYVGTNKRAELSKFISEFGKVVGTQYTPRLIAQWPMHAVFDFDRTPVNIPEHSSIILKNCDTAIYWNDSEPYKKNKLK